MKNTQSTSTKPGQLRRRLTSALVALGLVAGAMAMTAKPVEAATGVIACFYSNDSRVRVNDIPVWLQINTGGYNWVTVGSGTLSDFGYGGPGCVRFDIPLSLRNYYFRVKINDNVQQFGVMHWGEGSWIYPGYGMAYTYDWMFSTPGAFAY